MKTQYKDIFKLAQESGANIIGNQIDFGMGCVIEVIQDNGKIIFDGGESGGVEGFDNCEDAILALGL
jgi:hypothetical protein